MSESVFPSRLRQLRGNISQSDFAARTGIKQTTLSAYERGKSDPTASNILLICLATGASADWLLGLTKDDPSAIKPVSPGMSCADCPALAVVRTIRSALADSAFNNLAAYEQE